MCSSLAFAPRPDAEVAGPGHRRVVVGPGGGGLGDRLRGVGGLANGATARSNAATSSCVPEPARARIARTSAEARSIGRVPPRQPHAGRAVDQHDDQAAPLDRLLGQQEGPGEQQGDQRHAGQPQGQQDVSLEPPLPRVVAQDDLEELERAQLDRPGLAAEHQVDDDRDRQGAQGRRASRTGRIAWCLEVGSMRSPPRRSSLARDE